MFLTQFFRADTPRFQKLVESWIQDGIVKEWKGEFRGKADFFGFPSRPPFYVGVGGMDAIPKHLLSQNHGAIKVWKGQRVSKLMRNDDTRRWTLYGTSGESAYHDSKESIARSVVPQPIGSSDYDVVIVTDVSSSFDAWHRASAGLPADFSQKVRKRAGSRTPLFSCMIAFKDPLPIDVSAAAITHEDLWFVARTSSKPGIVGIKDCWTLISTPSFAMRLIKETPMQDPRTGEFLPQEPGYLTKIPGPKLENAFRKIISDGRLGGKLIPEEDIPPTIFLDAQRWGSAIPVARHLSESSSSRQVISGVAYDFCPKTPLAPTELLGKDESYCNFVADNNQMLFQAGDMVSTYTPGFEGAALSGIEVAEYIYDLLSSLSPSSDNNFEEKE